MVVIWVVAGKMKLDPTEYELTSSGLYDLRNGKKTLVASSNMNDVVAYFSKKRKTMIRSEIEAIDEGITELLAERDALRLKCKHKNATHKYRSNAGNYDPSSDCYWIEFKCYDCGMHWTEDQ